MPSEPTPDPDDPRQPSDTLSPSEAPSLWRLLCVWLSLGAQSFGGGVATLTLIRRTFVEQERWISDAEFTRNWALVQLVAGINLLGLTILIGRRIRGASGIVASLAGLLLPSVAVTILLSASYAHIRHSPLVRDALHGIIPAIVGLGLLTAFQIVSPLFRASRREGAVSLVATVAVLAGSGLAAVSNHGPVLLILMVGGLSLALLKWLGQSVVKSG
jgi:chromate transporter